MAPDRATAVVPASRVSRIAARALRPLSRRRLTNRPHAAISRLQSRSNITWPKCNRSPPHALASRGTEISNALKATAAITDLSHARVLLHLSGSKRRAMLAKVCSLDLHPAAFPPGAATTSLNHTNVVLWRDPVGVADSFNMPIFATFAESLCGTLLDAAAEYGVKAGP